MNYYTDERNQTVGPRQYLFIIFMIYAEYDYEDKLFLNQLIKEDNVSKTGIRNENLAKR